MTPDSTAATSYLGRLFSWITTISQHITNIPKVSISALAALADALHNTRKLLVSTIFVLAVLALIVVTYQRWNRNALLLEPFTLPPAFLEAGYTPDVVSQHLIDKITAIQRGATSRMERSQISLEEIDVELQDTGISLNSLIRIARQALNLHDRRLYGEITHTAEGYELQLRSSEGPHIVDKLFPRVENMPSVIMESAKLVVKFSQPYALASYYLSVGERRSAEEMILYCLTNQPVEDDPWAYNLWGEIFQRDGDYKSAIFSYRSALKLDDMFYAAKNNWAWVEHERGNDADALTMFNELAIDVGSHPYNAVVHNNIGAIYLDQGKLDEAISKFREAIELDDKLGIAYYNWGKALTDRGEGESDHWEAIKRYRTALVHKESLREFKKIGATYNNWGWSLLQLGHLRPAEKMFGLAILKEPNNKTFQANLALVKDRIPKDTE